MSDERASQNPLLSAYFLELEQHVGWHWKGRVTKAVGQTIESEGPPCTLGEECQILDRTGQRNPAEVIGFQGEHVLTMPLGAVQGLRYNDSLIALGRPPEMKVGEGLIGRVLDGSGLPIDGGRQAAFAKTVPLDGSLPSPLDRVPIRTALGTGIRAIDALLTIGRGQRVGIFGGSGVGKSTLIGMMTRNSAAEVIVVGLVGERGREVGEFLQESLGDAGRQRSVVLVSTSDQPPLLRIRAALAATSIAEYFAAQGRHVLLILDSLTRFAMAAREVGLAAGEPPTAKGYTPSVYSKIARLVERAGQFRCGSITALYTVLMEGDDQQDPLVDAVRSMLDGHVVLSRGLASEGWYPPIQVLDSISRLMPAVVSQEHRRMATLVRSMLAIYARCEDLVRIGAYKAGSDSELDRAMSCRDELRRFLMQDAHESVTAEQAIDQLRTLAGKI